MSAAEVLPANAAVLTGEHGLEALRRLGGSRGALVRLIRVFRFLSMDQMPDVVMYEASLRDGRAVIAVRPGNRARLPAANAALAQAGGHFANWFERFATEEISRWQGPEPAIPDYLRR